MIKNAIICWNYLYLSRELAAEKNEERKAKLLEAIENSSVMTWRILTCMVSSIFPMKNVGFGWFVISQKITLKNALNLGSPYVVQPPPP